MSNAVQLLSYAWCSYANSDPLNSSKSIFSFLKIRPNICSNNHTSLPQKVVPLIFFSLKPTNQPCTLIIDAISKLIILKFLTMLCGFISQLDSCHKPFGWDLRKPKFQIILCIDIWPTLHVLSCKFHFQECPCQNILHSLNCIFSSWKKSQKYWIRTKYLILSKKSSTQGDSSFFLSELVASAFPLFRIQMGRFYNG